MNEIVNERLLMELYGPPFAAAVANASGVMWCARLALRRRTLRAAKTRSPSAPPPRPRSAYNLVNGVYACENPFTLRTMLKGRYGFTGYVVCASAAAAAARVRSQLSVPPPPRPRRSRLGRLPQHDGLPAGGPRH